MSQSRIMSMVEVATSTLIGFLVAMWANYVVLPRFGFAVNLSESSTIALVFTAISLVRTYLVRRFFAAYVTRFAAWCRRSTTTSSR